MTFTASLACANYLNLEKDISDLIEGGIYNLHIDIMDGRYVPNLSINYDIIKQVKKRFPEVEMDAHLMVEKPEAFITPLIDSGVSGIDFHAGSTSLAYKLLSNIKENKLKAGVVLNPCEPLCLIDEIIKYVDRVVIMGVEPGFYGQKFIPDTLQRIVELHRIREENRYSIKIVVDGGINIENGKACAGQGADILVLGYLAVFNQPTGIINASRNFLKAVTSADSI